MSLYPGVLSMPQLFKKATMFNQNPVVNGGYNAQTPGMPVRILVQDEPNAFKTMGGATVQTGSETVWSIKLLVSGGFIYWQGVVYRIISNQSWQTQAGYYVYKLERVIGDNGSPSFDPKANLGGRDFT